MRKNKKNWEIFSKSVKNNAIVCDHIPTTPALITTTHNRENNMNKSTTLLDVFSKLLRSSNINYVDSVEIETNKKGNKLGFVNATNESELTIKFESHCEDPTAYYKFNTTYKLVKINETVEKIK